MQRRHCQSSWSTSLTFYCDFFATFDFFGCIFSKEDSSIRLYDELVMISDSSDRFVLTFSTITGTFIISLNETDELDDGVDVI